MVLRTVRPRQIAVTPCRAERLVSVFAAQQSTSNNRAGRAFAATHRTWRKDRFQRERSRQRRIHRSLLPSCMHRLATKRRAGALESRARVKQDIVRPPTVHWGETTGGLLIIYARFTAAMASEPHKTCTFVAAVSLGGY
jgi:hypothetical protein